MDMKETAELVKSWIKEAREKIIDKAEYPLLVSKKTSPTDLVTNLDREIEAFYIEKIRQAFPNDQIIGEEGESERPNSIDGRVWFVDPIDGTLNFVFAKEDYCTMLALYEDGVGKLAFIVDIVKDEWLWGGPELGLFQGEEELVPPLDTPLSAGLMGINGSMYAKNLYHGQEIAGKTMGPRISGCAGVEFIRLLKGQHIAYMSFLAPWDVAPGAILADLAGLEVGMLDGALGAFDFHKRTAIAVGTKSAYAEMMFLNKESH